MADPWTPYRKCLRREEQLRQKALAAVAAYKEAGKATQEARRIAALSTVPQSREEERARALALGRKRRQQQGRANP